MTANAGGMMLHLRLAGRVSRQSEESIRMWQRDALFIVVSFEGPDPY